jgi:hypothetical protein
MHHAKGTIKLIEKSLENNNTAFALSAKPNFEDLEKSDFLLGKMKKAHALTPNQVVFQQ